VSFFENPPLHDFPDRAIRQLLSDPRNPRDLLMEVVPDIAARLDFGAVEVVDRSFLMEDWRRREVDLFFRIPFRSGEGQPPVLVCVLVEHQSGPDARMPLRTLLYAVLYWEREWKAWEDRHQPGEPLRLTPILPIVFHTSGEPWRTNRTLAELIGGPRVFQAFVPQWQPLFWDLAERSPEALLQSAGAWMKALAVVRAEEEEDPEFEAAFQEVLARLEDLPGEEDIRRLDLIWFVISWALRRRPPAERKHLISLAEGSQKDIARRREMETMSKVIEQRWEDELLARGEARGELRGRLHGQQTALRVLLEDQFGPLPESVVRRIEEIEDPDQLNTLIRRAPHVHSVEELGLTG
jgi:hypothetical protein